jgi:hypothetical protein
LTSTVKRLAAEDAWNGAALKAVNVRAEEASRSIERGERVEGVASRGTEGEWCDDVVRKDVHITRSMA